MSGFFDDPAAWQAALETLSQGFSRLPAFAEDVDVAELRRVLAVTAERLQDNAPYQHPLYIGQMLKPPHPIARLAFALAMCLNPNNHALDGGRASTAMEREAVARLATMVGWPAGTLGHLCGGGTLANLEALWIARELAPGKAVAASSQAHYTHERLSRVLQIPFRKIPCDGRGRMSVAALREALGQGEIGTVVTTLGTTAAGAVDPLDDIVALRGEFDFRVHVDAAYGGYFTLIDHLDAEARAAFDCLPQADSVVIDPHKHGLQPYGCGCVLFRDASVARFYHHDSPYTYFSSDDIHLGEISLECSRAGAAAVALWATLEMFPLVRGGAFAERLTRSRRAALGLYDHLRQDRRLWTLFPPQLDIVVWAVRAPTASEASLRSRRIFEAAAGQDLHLALAKFPRALFGSKPPVEQWDADEITCLRACAMKPEHLDWLPQITAALTRAVDEITRQAGA